MYGFAIWLTQRKWFDGLVWDERRMKATDKPFHTYNAQGRKKLYGRWKNIESTLFHIERADDN